jgi:predicted AlkP superfamily pyrophosphatase or phosphodiesterase
MSSESRPRITKYFTALAIFFALSLVSVAQQNFVVTVDHGPNSAAQQSKPYVVLVSLDGFRWDYATKYGAKNLLNLAAHGASAPQGMIPSYPSVTFPNHLSIITGLYPEHHGIVANIFYDPALKDRYAYNDVQKNSDGKWYGGVPLWSLAEQQGMRSATFFWPGAEAEIAGERASYYVRYDDKIPDATRVDTVLSWLNLPPAQRPHFLTLYYDLVDHNGHEFGPESAQVADAVHHVDDIIGRLMSGITSLKLPVDVIVVSDHGMATVEGSWINLDQFTDLAGFEYAGSLLYAPSEAASQKVYEQLKGASDKFTVYRRIDVPANLHYNSNPREGDPVVIPTGPYMIRAHAPSDPAIAARISKGMHGYDPYKMKEMFASFYAEGPDFKPGATIAPFENINLYPLIAHILGLNTAEIDGRLDVLKGLLQSPAAKAAAH